LSVSYLLTALGSVPLPGERSVVAVDEAQARFPAIALDAIDHERDVQLGSKHIIDNGSLVELFPDWPGELFPLYALYPSRQHRAAKVRAFVDFAIGALTGAAARDADT
jgi:hypothetical protein